MRRLIACGILVISLCRAVLCPAALADNVPAFISGNAWGDNDNDQRVNLLFGSPLPGAFMNNGNTPVPTPYDCVVGEKCHILKTIAGVFDVPRTSAETYSYDFAYVQLYFDMITTDPVQSITPLGSTAFATGTFTGVLEYFDCGPGADCPFYNVPNQDTCIGSGERNCPPILLQTYSLSGVAEGYTETFNSVNGPPTVDFDFNGTAQAVPEPASVFLVCTGLTLSFTRLRRSRTSKYGNGESPRG